MATDGTQPPFPSPPGGRQLAVRRRAPPFSNSSASASAPITGRAGTDVQVVAPVARGPGRDGHRHGARGRGRDRRHVARVVPLQLRRAAVPDDQVFELEAGHRLREGDRDGEGAGDTGALASLQMATVSDVVSASTQLSCAESSDAWKLAGPVGGVEGLDADLGAGQLVIDWIQATDGRPPPGVEP